MMNVVNSNFNIVDLSDDCLYEIFKFHTFFELMTIGDTNQRFRELTSSVLAKEKKLDLMCYPFKHPDDNDGKNFLKATQRALKLYGHRIETMKYILMKRPAAVDVFSLMVKHCGALTDLTLGDINQQESSRTMKLLLPIFKHLKSLTLENYDLWLTYHLELILPNCLELEKLTLDVLKRCSGSMSHIYEIDITNLLRNLKTPLKELSLLSRSRSSWDGDIAVTSLSPIFKQKQLRVFEMINFHGEKIDMNVISNFLPALEVLSITIDDRMSFEPLLKLHRLTRLQLCVTNDLANECADFMNRLTIHCRLEHLSLRFKRISSVPLMEWDIAVKKVLDAVITHTSLKSLELKFDSLLEDKLQCAAKLPNLNHFTFIYDDLFNIPGWNEERRKVRLSILKFVSEVPTLQTLNMTFVENIWDMAFFEAILKIRSTQVNAKMLHIYDYSYPYQFRQFRDKYFNQYKLMKSNFVNVFSKLNRLYP